MVFSSKTVLLLKIIVLPGLMLLFVYYWMIVMAMFDEITEDSMLMIYRPAMIMILPPAYKLAVVSVLPALILVTFILAVRLRTRIRIIFLSICGLLLGDWTYLGLELPQTMLNEAGSLVHAGHGPTVVCHGRLTDYIPMAATNAIIIICFSFGAKIWMSSHRQGNPVDRR